MKERFAELFGQLRILFASEKLKAGVKNIVCNYIAILKNPRIWLWVIILAIITGTVSIWNIPEFTFGDHLKQRLFVLAFLQQIFQTLILILVVSSNTFEKVVRRLFEPARKIATAKEKEQLLPLFDVVYESYRQKYRFVSSSISLYILDSISVEAYTFGKTIVVSRGMIEHFSEEQLQAVIAHEMAHIVNGDSLLCMLLKFASTPVLWLAYLASWLLDEISELLHKSLLGNLIGIVKELCDLLIYGFIFAFSFLIGSSNRKQEYRADYTVFKLGLGEDLLDTLYAIYDMELSRKNKAVSRLQNSHPHTAFRIEALEEVLE